MDSSFISGNGNGNKMNLRIEILENLLNATGDGTSAKINTLRQTIRRNKSDMADDTSKTLDLLRQVFQNDFTEEIKAIIDRHLRTTFAPAFENLKRNGYNVTQQDIDNLACSILDGAKESFTSGGHNSLPSNLCIPSYATLKRKRSICDSQNDPSRAYESDENESDASVISSNSQRNDFLNSTGLRMLDRNYQQAKKRGRPRKLDVDSNRNGLPLMRGSQPVSQLEALRWNPERVKNESRFVVSSKANKLLGFGHKDHIFIKYNRLFRYLADDEDKSWLFSNNYSTRIAGRVFLILLEDCLEICTVENSSSQTPSDLQRLSFNLPEKIVHKIRVSMLAPFEHLKQRVIESAQRDPNNFFPPQAGLNYFP